MAPLTGVLCIQGLLLFCLFKEQGTVVPTPFYKNLTYQHSQKEPVGFERALKVT